MRPPGTGRRAAALQCRRPGAAGQRVHTPFTDAGNRRRKRRRSSGSGSAAQMTAERPTERTTRSVERSARSEANATRRRRRPTRRDRSARLRRRNRAEADPGGSARLVQDEGIEIVDVRFVDLPGTDAALLGPRPPAHRGRLRGGLRVRRLVDPGVPGDPGVGHAAHARPEHGRRSTRSGSTGRSTSTASCATRSPSSPTRATPGTWPRRPRRTSRSTGLADTCYFGPEAEFFIFDDVRYSQDRRTRLLPGRLDRGALEHGPQTKARTSGTRSAPRRGTSRSRPTDHFQDLRSRDDPHHGAARHRDRGPAPRGGDRRPGRDRHALRHAARRWPTS